jgi:hypothetical protein
MITSTLIKTQNSGIQVWVFTKTVQFKDRKAIQDGSKSGQKNPGSVEEALARKLHRQKLGTGKF